MGKKHPYFRRKTPEEILKEIQDESRGKLKLYIGAAPGVGKTYKMLQDAHDLVSEGFDVVIGLIETHGRVETEKQIKNLEHVPLKEITYKNKMFFELNVEGVIERKPDIVVVDELAHTNIKGSNNVKRYLDVEEILTAGIDVMSAVNIQHMESVHDIVENITGIRVRERIPDTFVDKANEIQLIDVTPITLRKRLSEGKIYTKEKIMQSLTNFFTEANLSALRELALREVADDVDEKIEQKNGHSFKGPIGLHEKILVCVQYSQTAEKLIRRGWRMANRLKAELYVLNVVNQDPLNMTNLMKQKIDYWRELCEQLNANFILEQKGKSKPSKVIVEVAKRHFITQILLGQSARTRWEEITKGSIVNEIMRDTTNIDIHIVADSKSIKED
ncbi:KdpD-like non-kinase potassium sensor [Metabacillus sediminilitoris]|uniref:Sensor histidine kinase KdpD n=1 Tax=Metabacillus sediminilitoris TaxID=2567941 RepID=A0A4S4BWQ5_9BACI|nr:KdpD-like non-kinase potassium sensor [Metabacillus sediminilitoris]QGQ44767.1 sensor histidine kinase KdpD [Metabacillus sediminilitoris]THF78885.1 sensor histidine kinase KdpD [Metabacillus sediminilitoris]